MEYTEKYTTNTGHIMISWYPQWCQTPTFFSNTQQMGQG